MKRLKDIAYDLADLVARTDITAREKFRILIAFLALKVDMGGSRFLEYTIVADARPNMVGIS